MHRSLGFMASLALTTFPTAALARTLSVGPTDSIQKAVAGASAGDTILVEPGVYHEGAAGDLNAIAVTTPGLQIVGLSSPGHPVVLESRPGQSYGLWVSPADSVGATAQADPERPPCATSGARLAGFALRGFTIRNFAEHGAHLACSDDFVLANNQASGNSVYGLFPSLSRHGIVANNVVEDTPKDAAIYVGQSEDVAVVGNVARTSLLGIEIENSRNCVVSGNDVYGNTTGILVDVLPNLFVKVQERTLLSANWVHDNNKANTAVPGDITAALFPGTGVLLLGADTTNVVGNAVTGNQLSGIAVLSYCTGAALAGAGCDGIDIDPSPDENRIAGNLVVGNATVPVPVPEVDALRADLSWDGSGSNDCWTANRFGTSVPDPLPACP